MSWTFIILSFLLYTGSAVFSWFKINPHEKRSKWEKGVVLMVCFSAFLGLYLQVYSGLETNKKAGLETTQHQRELLESRKISANLFRQNQSLRDSVRNISSENHKMLTTLYNFSFIYNKNSKYQDSVNKYITGGDNIPLLTAEANFEEFSDLNRKLFKLVISQFYISNRGDVPIYNIHYTFWNPIDFTNTERSISAIGSHNKHLLAADYSKEIYKFPFPENRDTIEFAFEVTWTARHVRSYTTLIDLIKLSNGGIRVKQTYKNGKGIVFDPTLVTSN
ncbi:hypothetical protein ACPPVU_24100 [Mucilaginibacter sp. McL0603]|uniref:hypothetical protein n=1 Tax=Mucilaginibacter sp. McL0603 TaxID=3415670 RepID=UPI003CFB2136